MIPLLAVVMSAAIVYAASTQPTTTSSTTTIAITQPTSTSSTSVISTTQTTSTSSTTAGATTQPTSTSPITAGATTQPTSTSPIAAGATTQPTSTSSTTASPTPPVFLYFVNIRESAFFKCGENVYENDSISQGILFPPSDISMPNVTNITEAEEIFKYTYDTFCGKLNYFTQCVNEKLANNASDVDRKLKVYIDMDNLYSALDIYCNYNEIPTYLHCTIQAVQNTSCPIGGIMGILDYVVYAIEASLPKSQYCSELKASIRCRVDQQLKSCSTSYAETMYKVYNAFTAKYCL
jgi:hypothetical protein